MVWLIGAGRSEQVETVEDFGQLTASGWHQITHFADAAADGESHGGGALAVAVGEHQGDLLLRVEGGQGFGGCPSADHRLGIDSGGSGSTHGGSAGVGPLRVALSGSAIQMSASAALAPQACPDLLSASVSATAAGSVGRSTPPVWVLSKLHYEGWGIVARTGGQDAAGDGVGLFPHLSRIGEGADVPEVGCGTVEDVGQPGGRERLMDEGALFFR